jgi:enoyl-CoA hydratase/carnithine racemase
MPSPRRGSNPSRGSTPLGPPIASEERTRNENPLLVTKRDDGVAVISTNHDPLNRMSVAYIDVIDVVIDDIVADDTIRALVLASEGTTNFSVGMNLEELGGAMRERGADALFDQRLDLISRIETMGKPSVATLFGYCLGGGLELPLGCTFRLAAAERASIGLPEMDLGTTPAWGGSAGWPRRRATVRPVIGHSTCADGRSRVCCRSGDLGHPGAPTYL